MDQIKYQAPSAEEFRKLRFSIHHDVHGLPRDEANTLADADVAKWLADQHATAAANDAVDALVAGDEPVEVREEAA
jgi:hypothetical protein